jgi:RimJ/RimL family protein N-acetyltransferase
VTATMGTTTARNGCAIHLKPLEMSHAPAMYKWMLDPCVADNIGLRSQPSLDRTEAWIQRAIAPKATLIPLAIYSTDRHIGNVVFDQIDVKGSGARMSIYIGETDARDKGSGTAAVAAALQHVFSARQFELVWLTVHHRNIRALRVYQKLGFQITAEVSDGIPSFRMELSRAAWDSNQEGRCE